MCTQCQEKEDKQHEPNANVTQRDHIPPVCVGAQSEHNVGKVPGLCTTQGSNAYFRVHVGSASKMLVLGI